MAQYKNQQGISLIELMIVVAITMLLVSLGGPSIVESLSKARLKSVSEETFFTFKQARSQALASSADVTLSFKTGDDWCIGMNDSGTCNCSTANSCRINGVESVTDYSDFDGIEMDTALFGADQDVFFDGQRGLTINQVGYVDFSDAHNKMRISLNALGRSNICVVNGQIASYPSC